MLASSFHIAYINVLLRCRRFRYAATGVLFHRWGLGFNQFRLHLSPLARISCVQDLQHFTLHIFTFSRFPNMLFSPSPFGMRWVGCPRRIFALVLLLLESYFITAKAAHAGRALLCTSPVPIKTLGRFLLF